MALDEFALVCFAPLHTPYVKLTNWPAVTGEKCLPFELGRELKLHITFHKPRRVPEQKSARVTHSIVTLDFDGYLTWVGSKDGFRHQLPFHEAECFKAS